MCIGKIEKHCPKFYIGFVFLYCPLGNLLLFRFPVLSSFFNFAALINLGDGCILFFKAASSRVVCNMSMFNCNDNSCFGFFGGQLSINIWFLGFITN